MTTFLYNIGITMYSFAIHCAAFFNEKANLLNVGRKQTWAKLHDWKQKNQRLIWFHAASLGEFEQGRPVIEKLKQAEPDTRILLTFFSPSGYEIRKNYIGADYICYLPADTQKNAIRFIETIRPDAAIFIKYEFWYHYLHELNKRQIPTYLISAIFRPEQVFFKKWGNFYRRILTYFTHIYVQDDVSVNLLNQIGVKQISKVGDTRFDRVKQIADEAKNIEKVAKFCHGARTIVCGSTWPPDEDILMEYMHSCPNHYKWIIAPHEIGENHIKTIIEKCKKKITRYSQNEQNIADFDVLIIDCIGLLSSIYRYGHIAYIGGGFGVGIHNTLEAAVYGIPVIFGPKYQKFNEAIQLMKKGGAFSIQNGTELKELLNSFTQNPIIAETAGKEALKYVHSQLGATEIIAKEVAV